jgi:hypothetical protein
MSKGSWEGRPGQKGALLVSIAAVLVVFAVGVGGGGTMTQQMVWKCEQWLGGKVKEQNVFLSEEQAREFARKLAGMSPDMVFKIEPMPIQHVWN